ncbi:hypothetical protein [Pseudomonas sp. MBLB4136]|uniref:hypothetical protein n=1 Tax=Pseudomonas sp. MBLB4136 TaxID=3451558 RepID=UPI003F74ED57
MDSKSSTGMPAGYPRSSRAMPSRYPGEEARHWRDADAPVIAANYLARLLQSEGGSGKARLVTSVGRGARHWPSGLAAYRISLSAKLHCAWLALKRYFSGSARHLFPSCGCAARLKRPSVGPSRRGPRQR